MNSKYLVDANIFIRAYRETYPMDIFPSFWEQLLEKGGPKIILLDKVYDEILKGNDDLVKWIKNYKNRFTNMCCNDLDIISCYKEIANSIQSNSRYNDNAIYEYFDVADSWVCAAAKAKNLIVVTNEVKSNATKRVKIPDVCERFSIEYKNAISFIRDLGMEF